LDHPARPRNDEAVSDLLQRLLFLPLLEDASQRLVGDEPDLRRMFGHVEAVGRQDERASDRFHRPGEPLDVGASTGIADVADVYREDAPTMLANHIGIDFRVALAAVADED